MRCTSPQSVVRAAAFAMIPLLALLGVGLVATMPGQARAITISGTISYSGSYGSVSSARPLRVVLHTYPRPPQEDEPLAEAAVSSNGGPFALTAPAAGDYLLGYWLDINNDDSGGVGEPIQFYYPLHVTAAGITGLALSLSDATPFSGIAGTVRYTGSRGVPSPASPLVVQAFTDPFLSGTAVKNSEVDTNGGPFNLITFDTGTYYLRAFLDLNHNGQLDPDEPFEIYQSKESGAGDPVVAGPNQTSIDLSFGDSTSFPIATTAAPELTVGTACDGSNFLVGIQTQTTVGAQLISPSGTTIGPVISTGRSGGAPGVSFNGTNYVLGWVDQATMYGQLVSPSGAVVGAPFQISQSTTVRDLGGAFDGTNYLVVWTDTRLSSTNGSLYYIYGQLVSASGSPLGGEIKISESAGKDASVAFGGGAYVVVWTETTTGATVMGRVISPAGAPVGSEFVINSSPAESTNPKAVAFGRTNFLVLWPDRVDGSGSNQWNIFGQLVTPTGALTGEVLPITSGPGEQVFPTLAFDGRNYLATWTNFTCNVFAGETCGEVHGQYLSQCGMPIGAAFPIGAGPGTQMISPVTFGAGQYLVLWNSDATLSHSGLIGGDVHGTFLAPAPAVACVGDCGGDHQVTVDELLTMVNIALGNSTVCACEAGDTNDEGQITVDEILTAVNNALNGC